MDMPTVLTRQQVRRVDQIAIDTYGMTGLVLMENAGRNAAAIIDKSYGPQGKALCLCGPGNNGGDGCVIARHLHNLGWTIWVLVTGDTPRMTPDTRMNFEIVERMGITRWVAQDWADQAPILAAVNSDDLIIDALLGTGFQGKVREPPARLIVAANGVARRATVAIDVPSGLDCDTGSPSNATIRADLTITFVAQKPGLRAIVAKPFVRRIVVADIGVPRGLVDDVAAEEL